jgi:outer membrane protein assembly factor BamB
VSEQDLAVSVGPREVFAVDVATGRQTWRIDRAYGPSSPPAVASVGGRDVVLFTAGLGEASSLDAVDASDGSPAWKHSVPLKATSRTGVAVDGERAFVGDDRGNVYASDVSTGAVRWTADPGGRTLAPLAAGSGMVVATTAGGQRGLPVVTGFDAATGAQRWRVEPNVFASGATSAVIVNGIVAIGFPDRSVHAFDVSDGSERWTSRPFFSLASPFGGGSAYRDDLIFAYFGDPTGDIRRLDGGTGAVVWDYPLNQAILRSPPVVSGSNVLVGLRDGSVAAIDAEGGELTFRTPPAGGLTGAIAVSPDVLVAVRGGSGGGLVGLRHAAGPLDRVASPSSVDVAALLGRFAAAVAIIGVVLLLPFAILRRRSGPALAGLGAVPEDADAADADDAEDAFPSPGADGREPS